MNTLLFPRIFAVLIFSVSPIFAQNELMRLGEFKVNTFTIGTQEGPAIAGNASGDFVVVWESDGQRTDIFDVYAQRYNTAGSPVGPQLRVSPSAANEHGVTPSVAMDSAGNFIVVWIKGNNDTSSQAVYARRFNVSANAFEAPILVSDVADAEDLPVIAVAPDGRGAIAWLTSTNGPQPLKARTFTSSASGIQLGGSTISVTGPQAVVDRASVAVATTGDFVLAWNEDQVFARIYSANGAEKSGLITVNETQNPSQARPNVSVRGDGKFTVVWKANNDQSGSGIAFRQFTVDGSADPGSNDGHESRVNMVTEDNQTEPSCSYDAVGNLIVIWTSDNRDGNGSGVAGQLFDTGGDSIGTEFLINTTVAGKQSLGPHAAHPKVVCDAQGNFVCIWNSEGQDGDKTGIYADKFFVPAPPKVLTVSATNPTDAMVTITGTVNPGSSPTRARVEYGLMASLGSSTDWQDVGSGHQDVPVSIPVPGRGGSLAPASDYFFRLVVENAVGMGPSAVQMFSTAPLRMAPNPAPVGDGTLRVNLTDVNGVTLANARWRLLGETIWRNNGDTLAGLVTGSYVVEFEPVNGVAPEPQVFDIAGTTIRAVSYPAGSAMHATGAISIVIKPDSAPKDVAHNASLSLRGQWRRVGEPAWHDSDEVVPGVPVGAALIEFKPVLLAQNYDFRPPGNVSVSVSANQTLRLTATYLTSTNGQGLPLPTPLSRDEVTGVGAAAALPWQFCGQIQSDAGFASGIAVRRRVVLTAAHVVFDDGTLSFATGVRWTHQRVRDQFEPPSQSPRGFYLLDGYATQRAADIKTPAGESTTASRELDAAAMYFVAEDCARGGASGYLAVEGTDWLTAARNKTLIGYPFEEASDGVTTISQADFGKMYHTSPGMLTFNKPDAAGNSGTRVYETTQILGLGGMSGGPLCVQWDDDNYYPAGIYLGGTNSTLVRGIDKKVGDLILAAQLSSQDDANHEQGGIVQANAQQTAGRLATAPIKVMLQTAAGGEVKGSGWRIAGEEHYQPSGVSSSDKVEGRYLIEFNAVKGFKTPPSRTVEVTSSVGPVLTVIYTPIQKPTITTPSLPAAGLGLAYRAALIAASNAPSSMVASGLPPGLSLTFDAKKHVGMIAGTPTKLGEFDVTITAHNDGGDGSAKFILAVRKPVKVTLNAVTFGNEVGSDGHPIPIAEDGGHLSPPSPALLADGTMGVPQQLYTFTAVPNKGFLFLGWQTAAGVAFSHERVLRFTLQNTISLIAQFIANPFTERAATYQGLAKLAPASLDTIGFVELKLSSLGAFSGKLFFGGVSYSLKGAIDGAGEVIGSIPRMGQTPIAFALHVPVTGAVTGVITGNFTVDNVTLALHAERAAVAGDDVLPEGGATFTLAFPSDPAKASDPKYPKGTGWGVAMLSNIGAIRFNGMLGDGTIVKQAVNLSKSGSWPFFAAPYGTKGVIAGTLALHSAVVAGERSFLDGKLDWDKAETAKKTSPKFDDPFAGTVMVEASQYVLPDDQERAIAVTNPVTITLSGGELPAPVVAAMSGISIENQVTVKPSDPHQLKLTLAPTAGTFSGSFIDTSITPNKARKIQGVLLKNQKKAAGLFLGDEQTGSLILSD